MYSARCRNWSVILLLILIFSFIQAAVYFQLLPSSRHWTFTQPPIIHDLQEAPAFITRNIPATLSHTIFDFAEVYRSYFHKAFREQAWAKEKLCELPTQYKELIHSICWNMSLCGTQIPCSLIQPNYRPNEKTIDGRQCEVRRDLFVLNATTSVLFPEGDHLRVTQATFDAFQHIRDQFVYNNSAANVTSAGIWMFGMVWESVVYYPYVADPEYLAKFNITVGTDKSLHAIREVVLPAAFNYVDRYSIMQTDKTEVPVVMMISNCYDRTHRLDYATELMKHINVDSYGSCLHNKDDPKAIGAYQEDFFAYKLNTISKYHFTLAFENSIANGYISEKLWQALHAGSIPVFMGAPDINEFLPDPNCIINTKDFATPKDLAEYLHLVLHTPELYAKHKNWYTKPPQESMKKLFNQPSTTSHAQLLCDVILTWHNLSSMSTMLWGVPDTTLSNTLV